MINFNLIRKIKYSIFSKTKRPGLLLNNFKQKILLIFITATSFAQIEDKFKQLDQEIATPNSYRTAAGYPGHEYWQNRANYTIDVKLNDENQTISGFETITYVNNSPDDLNYLWVQLDQNVRAKDSDSYKISTGKMRNKLNFS